MHYYFLLKGQSVPAIFKADSCEVTLHPDGKLKTLTMENPHAPEGSAVKILYVRVEDVQMVGAINV